MHTKLDICLIKGNLFTVPIVSPLKMSHVSNTFKSSANFKTSRFLSNKKNHNLTSGFVNVLCQTLKKISLLDDTSQLPRCKLVA